MGGVFFITWMYVYVRMSIYLSVYQDRHESTVERCVGHAIPPLLPEVRQ